MQVKRLRDGSVVPTKAYRGDAGWDLYAVEDGEIAPTERLLVGTGIAIAIPEGFYGRIADRSSMAYKFGMHVLAGVVDHGYRNEVKVLLVNLSTQIFSFKKGDRIAQLIVTPINSDSLLEVDTLDETQRGLGGFGSSGM